MLRPSAYSSPRPRLLAALCCQSRWVYTPGPRWRQRLRTAGSQLWRSFGSPSELEAGSGPATRSADCSSCQMKPPWRSLTELAAGSASRSSQVTDRDLATVTDR